MPLRSTLNAIYRYCIKYKNNVHSYAQAVSLDTECRLRYSYLYKWAKSQRPSILVSWNFIDLAPELPHLAYTAYRIFIKMVLHTQRNAILSVKATSLTESVHLSLRAAILNGVYPPGTMLRQEELAIALGVSRNPLREILPRLESEGLVILHPRRGYEVVGLNEEEIYDLFSLRVLLETDLVRRSAMRKRQIDEQRVLSALDEMAHIPVRPEKEALLRWFDLNLDFHDALLIPAGYPHHLKALQHPRGTLEAYIRANVQQDTDLSLANAEHTELAHAFVRGNVDLLVQLTRAHCDHVRDRLLLNLQKKAI